MRKLTYVACVLVLASLPAPGVRADEALRFGIEGNASFLWLIHEQNENGVRQPGSGDPSAEEASGFSFRQGRLGFYFISDEYDLEALLRFKLEEQTGVIDFHGAWKPAREFELYVGQMKIPSTAEVGTRDHLLDFVARTSFGRNVGDYSMARTPYISPFLGTNANNRDLGVAVKGDFGDGAVSWLRYFIMVGNGLGGNRYVGGKDKTEFVYANNFGDYFYGARLASEPADWLRVGGHYSLNRHEGAIYQDKKSVVDLDRESWSADLRLLLPWGMSVEGFYGEGNIDDYWTSQEYVYDYSGYGVWVVQAIFDGRLELAARYDCFITEFDQNEDETEQNNWTFGVNWRPNPYLRTQLNYVWKDTVNESVDDLDDDILYLNVQFMFDAWLKLI